MDKPLAGVKVLEMSTFVAAPTSSRLLADLGASVIKVENIEGDAWRKTGVGYAPSRFSDDENPVFDIYNAGKKHIALNLKTEDGMDIFNKLLSQSDVFITNVRVRSLKKLGISYDDVKDKYPGLIYASVLGYGEKGPEAAKPAFDTTAFWSRSGFLRDMAVDGENYTPVVPPSGVGDTVTGMFLMGEICAALYRRLKTGKGDYVRSTLYHNGIFAMGTMAIITQRPFGQVFPKTRAAHGAPGGYYKCSDGEWVFMSAGYAAHLIPALCNAINRMDILEDPKYADAQSRAENRESFYNIFREIFASKTSDEWIKIAEEFDLPLTRMNHFADVSEDEQAWANGFLEHVEFANGNVDVMPSSPIEMDSVGELKTVPAKKIGADTEEILTELGYTADHIQKMCDAGAVRTK